LVVNLPYIGAIRSFLTRKTPGRPLGQMLFSERGDTPQFLLFLIDRQALRLIPTRIQPTLSDRQWVPLART